MKPEKNFDVCPRCDSAITRQNPKNRVERECGWCFHIWVPVQRIDPSPAGEQETP